MTDSSTYFESDIAKHEMRIIRDDGVHRHIRFQRPGTMCMHFDLITWPGYLCYVGDMGCYVFKRLEDMFQFFRGHRPKLSYWAEKVEASDKCDGVQEFSADKFRAEVKDFYDQHLEHCSDVSEEDAAVLWSEIEDRVFTSLENYGEHGAWAALGDFEHEGFRFTDWERQCKEYTHRFVWCCHALPWAISMYDKAKEAE